MLATAPTGQADAFTRRQRAISLSINLVDDLADMGVTAKIIGSLASGQFKPDSDIDILITECPRPLKYRIESFVEDALDGFSFDVIYLDEIPAHRLTRFTTGAANARDLR